jgi:hypothetical protein
MALTRFDDKLIQGQYLNFEDRGIVSKGAKTRRYAVISRYNRSLVGYIKFFAQWRQYVLFPLNGMLNKDCLRETADFCQEVTLANREKRKPFPASVEKTVVEAGTEIVPSL